MSDCLSGNSSGSSSGAGTSRARGGGKTIDLDLLYRNMCATEEGNEGGTATIMPLVCSNCGMPVNNVQHAYETVMDGQPADAPADYEQQVYAWLLKDRLCCRVTLSRSAEDSRLKFTAPFQSSFVHIDRASKLGAPPVRVLTDGTTRIATLPPSSA
jgi:DNA-directed RNA polymerase subunit N (RpoN/RPB10)